MEKTVKIDVKEAVYAATQAADDFYEGVEIKSVILEEVEHDMLNSEWLITLSFNVPNLSSENPLFQQLASAGRYDKKLKLFRISDETGEVVSMKIRELQ